MCPPDDFGILVVRKKKFCVFIASMNFSSRITFFHQLKYKMLSHGLFNEISQAV